MLCKHCKENIEVGDACVPVIIGNKAYHYHPHCSTFANPVRLQQEDRPDELERVAQLARAVC